MHNTCIILFYLMALEIRDWSEPQEDALRRMDYHRLAGQLEQPRSWIHSGWIFLPLCQVHFVIAQ